MNKITRTINVTILTVQGVNKTSNQLETRVFQTAKKVKEGKEMAMVQSMLPADTDFFPARVVNTTVEGVTYTMPVDTFIAQATTVNK